MSYSFTMAMPEPAFPRKSLASNDVNRGFHKALHATYGSHQRVLSYIQTIIKLINLLANHINHMSCHVILTSRHLLFEAVQNTCSSAYHILKYSYCALAF